jgi:hypothetical protein
MGPHISWYDCDDVWNRSNNVPIAVYCWRMFVDVIFFGVDDQRRLSTNGRGSQKKITELQSVELEVMGVVISMSSI